MATQPRFLPLRVQRGASLRGCLLGAGSQQQLVPGALSMQQPEEEHMARDALELQAEVSNL